ncbi:MAG: 5-methyltetrahydrofolate--homocysteine methyltransferase, partial [Acidobacteria bacterium]|nr:5-methyltetrahydrofolate--homocysteine methyltransferase [Acidobacteriota bacterium]
DSGSEPADEAKAPAQLSLPRRIGGRVFTTESELKQLFSVDVPPTYFSTTDTPQLVEEKRRLKELYFRQEEVEAFVDRYFRREPFETAGFGPPSAFVVAPSTSGKNSIPLLLARRLAREFGGTVFDRGIEARNAEEAKLRRTYLQKVGNASRVGFRNTFDVAALVGRQVIMVDDILTSGETLNALHDALLDAGVTPAGVAVLGANQEGKPPSVVAVHQLARHLADACGVSSDDVLTQIRLAHRFAYSNLLRKAWQDAQDKPQDVYELICRRASDHRGKGEALRTPARVDVRGEHPPGPYSDSGRVEGPKGVGRVLPLETPQLAEACSLSGGSVHREARSTGSFSGLGGDAPALSLEDLVPFIDWSPFFHTWELRGRYPAILNHPKHGEEARKLFADARQLLEKIVAEKLIEARGVYGFFPANRVGDDVEIYADESRTQVLATFHFLRQQMEKTDGQPSFCLADFIAPKSQISNLKSQISDCLGAFAVSTGFGIDELVKKFKADHDDYNAIMAEALADRLAEAFAEFLHKRVRAEWGFGKTENLAHEDLIEEKYRGIRPAAGYPACPDHTEKRILWELLEVERRAGIKLTESCAMWPASSVSGLYFSHPESKYFAVGKLGRDQILDYHIRKGMPLQDVEKWLGPYLNYEPAKPGRAPAPMACACGSPH